MLAAGLLVAALALGIVWFWWVGDDERPPPLTAGWQASVDVLAGDGLSGVRDGNNLQARFSDPSGVAVGTDGLIYVADGAEANRIRAISPEGDVTTFAGSDAGFVDGSARRARFSTPSGLAFGPHGMLYVADTGNNAIRRISPLGETTTVAGRPESGFRNGALAEALFNGPIGVAVDAAGRIFVADTYNDRVRVIQGGGTVTTIAGATRGLADGRAGEARFDTPTGLAVDPNGTLYVADTGNDRVRTIAADGTVSTLIDPSHGLVRPVGIALAPSGELYVTTEDGRLFERASDGTLRSVAGSAPGFRDGPGGEAQFRRPAGIAWRAPGSLIVADGGNALVRRVDAHARRGARPPPSPRISPRFDVERFAQQPLLWPLRSLTGPFEIAGTLGEARGEGAGRFHAGIDVRAEHGEVVVPVRNGVIAAPLAVSAFGTLNESVRVGSLAYVHLRAGRDRRDRVTDEARFAPTFDDAGRLIDIRVKRGARFDVGDVLGTVNRFNHVHLNVGWSGEEFNPLLLGLVQHRDSIPPTISAGGIQLFSSDGRRLTACADRRLLVSGDVQIVVDAWDQSDGNQANRRLGLFELGYQLLLPDGTPAPGFTVPRMTIRFDRSTSDATAPALVYAPGSGIPFYGERRTRFRYVVTNTFRDGRATAGVWRATESAPGDYTLRIHATDASGNAASINRDLAIRILR